MNPGVTDSGAPAPEPAATSGKVFSGIDERHGWWELPPEAIPNIDDIEISDGKPVDSIIIEMQMRLLVEPLHSSWSGPGEGRPFMALSNVGLFYKSGDLPLVPDMMLSVDVQVGDVSIKENNSYFVWIIGKVPDVVIEIVSDRRGGEESYKFDRYARIGIPYYVIFDPKEYLKGGVLRAFALHARTYHPTAPDLFPEVGLGLKFWQGTYSTLEHLWLRWCDRNGQVILTGKEQAEQAKLQAEQAKLQADQAKQEADEERQRAERLLAQLRAAGIEPQA